MALQKTVVFSGITVTDAYLRVDRIDLKKGSMLVVVATQPARGQDPLCYQGYQMNYDITGDNPIRQGYEQLKALSDFTGATDVLEAGQTA